MYCVKIYKRDFEKKENGYTNERDHEIFEQEVEDTDFDLKAVISAVNKFTKLT